MPAVVQFTVDRNKLAELDTVWFVRGSFDADDFWSLVHHCRHAGGDHRRGLMRRKQPVKWYDVVVGPVAASWRQRLAISDADQASFHSAAATGLLNASNPVLI